MGIINPTDAIEAAGKLDKVKSTRLLMTVGFSGFTGYLVVAALLAPLTGIIAIGAAVGVFVIAETIRPSVQSRPDKPKRSAVTNEQAGDSKNA